MVKSYAKLRIIMGDSRDAPVRQTLIESGIPTHWRDLEKSAGRILSECGFEVEVGATLDSARGLVKFDVCARDASAAPSTLIVVECKLWRRAVPQGEVHRFRTTLADAGAGIGFVVSSRGFQAGARRAAIHTNVRLVTWEEFQSIFIERWYQNHMLNVIRRESLRLFGYTVDYGAFFMELFWHSQDVHEEAQELSDKYYSLANFTRTLL
ncbi:restriction endonuclease [Amycolatopsis thermoflava]|uniref:restriction endonuclease n=1 Tax=Amycolatopsis thermoflava TaxID=84480 RepID=UPI00364F0314